MKKRTPTPTDRLHTLLKDATVDGLWFEVSAQIDLGADVNMPDAEGFTPLLRCLTVGCNKQLDAKQRAQLQSVLSLLLKSGAGMDILSPQGLSATSLASFWPDAGEAGKRLECETYRRSDPYLLANVSEVSLYWPKPGTPATPAIVRSMIKACSVGDVEKVKYMAHIYPRALGWIDNDTASFEITPLIAAAIGSDARRKSELLAFLVNAGADINWQNDEGNSALHYACSPEHRSFEAVKHLIALGADEKLRNNAGKTAHDMARVRGFSSAQVCIETLDTALKARTEAQARAQARPRLRGGSGFRF